MKDLQLNRNILKANFDNLFNILPLKRWEAARNIIPVMGVSPSVYRGKKYIKITYITPLNEERVISLRIGGSILENAKRIHR